MAYDINSIPKHFVSVISPLPQDLQDIAFSSFAASGFSNRIITILVDEHLSTIPASFTRILQDISIESQDLELKYFDCGSRARVMHVRVGDQIPMIMIFGDSTFNVTDFLREIAVI